MNCFFSGTNTFAGLHYLYCHYLYCHLYCFICIVIRFMQGNFFPYRECKIIQIIKGQSKVHSPTEPDNLQRGC